MLIFGQRKNKTKLLSVYTLRSAEPLLFIPLPIFHRIPWEELAARLFHLLPTYKKKHLFIAKGEKTIAYFIWCQALRRNIFLRWCGLFFCNCEEFKTTSLLPLATGNTLNPRFCYLCYKRLNFQATKLYFGFPKFHSIYPRGKLLVFSFGFYKQTVLHSKGLCFLPGYNFSTKQK